MRFRRAEASQRPPGAEIPSVGTDFLRGVRFDAPFLMKIAQGPRSADSDVSLPRVSVLLKRDTAL